MRGGVVPSIRGYFMYFFIMSEPRRIKTSLRARRKYINHHASLERSAGVSHLSPFLPKRINTTEQVMRHTNTPQQARHRGRPVS